MTESKMSDMAPCGETNWPCEFLDKLKEENRILKLECVEMHDALEGKKPNYLSFSGREYVPMLKALLEAIEKELVEVREIHLNDVHPVSVGIVNVTNDILKAGGFSQ